MKVYEVQDRRRRCTYWDLPDQGWEDVAGNVDPFLATAILGISAEYSRDPVEWLEINHWIDSGRLIVFPAHDGPYGNRGERIYFELQSAYVENESLRIFNTLSDEVQAQTWEALNQKVWKCVGDSLRSGKASRQLAQARKLHRLRLAAFDYGFGEGSFHLTELDEEAAVEMYKALARSKRE